MEDDKALVESCLSGREEGYKMLYDQYAPLLYAQCLRMMHTESLAEDALQESFINIFQNIHQFRGEKPLLHWMRRIVTTTSLRLLKRNHAVHFSELKEVHHSVEDEDVYFHEDDVAYILSLIKSLPIGYRTIFNLFEIEGYSHKEISELLGIDIGTSRSQLYKAKRILQSKLQHYKNMVS